MNLADGPTRFSNWRPIPARAALAVTALVIAGFLGVASATVTRPIEDRPGDTDGDLFRKVVQRVHAGASPYDAFERTFREYDYPVRSVFNYRTPLLTWFLGRLPGPAWGRAILAALMLATALMAYATLARQGSGPVASAVALLLMMGTFSYSFIGDTYLYYELWAGTLIALSICAYDLGRRPLGVATGLLALFLRELALPYALISWLIAWRQGRRREAAAWAVGLAFYSVSLILHILAVMPRIPAARGTFNGSSWVHFGGPAFLLATCRINLLLLASPPWVVALYLPLCLLGLLGWRGETSLRIGLIVAFYLAAFSVLGALFNFYWGLLYGLLLPFGLAWAPASLRDLWSASFRTRAGLPGRWVRESGADGDLDEWGARADVGRRQV
jgi:hypothetical protein